MYKLHGSAHPQCSRGAWSGGNHFCDHVISPLPAEYCLKAPILCGSTLKQKHHPSKARFCPQGASLGLCLLSVFVLLLCQACPWQKTLLLTLVLKR